MEFFILKDLYLKFHSLLHLFYEGRNKMKKMLMFITLLLCIFITPVCATDVPYDQNATEKPQLAWFRPLYNGFTTYVYTDVEEKHVDVYRATSKDGKYYKINPAIQDVREQEKLIEVSGLTTGKTYYFKIRAYKEDSNGKKTYSKSTYFEYTPQLGYVSLDVIVTNPKKHQYKVSWWKVDGAHGYNLYRSKDGRSYKKVCSTKKLSYDVTTKHDYTYRIKAYRKVNGKYVYGGYSYADATWRYQKNYTIVG